MSEHAQTITPGLPDLPHVGWREVVTREHLPRLLVLCLAIWLHVANTPLAATTMPEAVGDIGGLRLISWAFALYLMGSIVAATAVSAYVASAGLRRTMLASTLIYTLGCAVCAAAPAMPVRARRRADRHHRQRARLRADTHPEEFRTAALWLFGAFVPPALFGVLIAWRFSNLIAAVRRLPLRGE